MNKKFSTLMAASLVLAGSLWSGDAWAETYTIGKLADLTAITSESNGSWSLNTAKFTTAPHEVIFENAEVLKLTNVLTIGVQDVKVTSNKSKGIEGHLDITATGVTVDGLTIYNRTTDFQPMQVKTGITISSSATDAVVTNNTIIEPDDLDPAYITYGIAVKAPAEKMTIEGNTIKNANAFVKGSKDGSNQDASYGSWAMLFMNQTSKKDIAGTVAKKNTIENCWMDYADQRGTTTPYYFSAKAVYNPEWPEAVVDVLESSKAASGTKFAVIEGAGAADVISAINAADTYAKTTDGSAVIARNDKGSVNVVVGASAEGIDSSLDNVVLTLANNKVTVDFTNSTAAVKEYSGKDLNAILFNGFKLSLKDNDGEAIDNGDIISGKLLTAEADDLTAKTFKLKTGKDKYLAINEKGWTNITNAEIRVVEGAKDKAAEFSVIGVDGQMFIYYTVAGSKYYLKVVNTTIGSVLTAEQSENPVQGSLEITFDESTMVNALDINNNPFLDRYVTLTFVSDDKAKNGKVLGVDNTSGTTADLVEATRYLQAKPEGQWVVTLAEANESNTKFTLVNREKPGVTLENVIMYVDNAKKNQYRLVYDGAMFSGNDATSDLFVINAVDSKLTVKDFYVNFENKQIKDTQYRLAVASTEETDFYVTENHAGKHLLGLTKEETGAANWFVVATGDTAIVVNDSYEYNSKTKEFEEVSDTLFIPTYAFQNAGNKEFMTFEYAKGELALDETAMICDKDVKSLTDIAPVNYAFVLKKKGNDLFNIVSITPKVYDKKDNTKVVYYGLDLSRKLFGATTTKNGQIQVEQSWEDVNSNDLFRLNNIEAPEYHKVVNGFGEVVKIYRADNESQVLYEKADSKSVVENEVQSFLNIDNVEQFKDINPALFVDTAYINRGTKENPNTCWQYLLGVKVNSDNDPQCPYNPLHNTQEWRDEHNGGKPCADAVDNASVKGRYLVNVIDSANMYGISHLHNNPYIDRTEAGEPYAKLSFVDGIHVKDTLYVIRNNGDSVKVELGTPDFSIAKFAFRYVNPADKADTRFKIQTQYKRYLGDDNLDSADEIAKEYADNEGYISNEGYLKWINGTVVVVPSYELGDIFNINENEDRTPTANEAIDASAISVSTIDGAVVVKGAEGKNVVITNVLGQQVANTVASSNEVTISAPAGIVVVAVEGEAAVKAIVK